MRRTTSAAHRENIRQFAGSAWPVIMLPAVLLFASFGKACE
jgi:hypothetical protein